MDIFNKRDVENELINWELYKAYGHFNLCFEAIIASFREYLIEMVRLSYGFDVDWEDPHTEEELDSHLQDRLLKIILHDDGANTIIEKCKSCFNDMMNPKIRQVLLDNDIEPLPSSQRLISVAELIFKSSSELVRLRNIIIHSHYEGVVFDIYPRVELTGRKDVRIAGGYEERYYKLDVKYLTEKISDMENLYYMIHKFIYNSTVELKADDFSDKDISFLRNLSFQIVKTSNK